MSDTVKTKSSTAADEEAEGFSDFERAAMKERAQELKGAKRRGGRGKADPEAAVLAKIAEMPEPDRTMAQRLHEVIKAGAPDLSAKLWYGMPAYAKGGKVVCFFQSAQKFETRYSTLGFNDEAKLDDGDIWPTAYALAKWTAAVEEKVVTLVQRAVS